MHKLIYRDQTLEFKALFMEAAMNHIAKLTFTTREEYLAWVKQWKEDYKNIVHFYTIEKYNSHPATTEERIKWYANKVDKLKARTGFWGENTSKKRIEELKAQIFKEYGMHVYGLYAVVLYLLVVRKASKIRANAQRNARLLTPATV